MRGNSGVFGRWWWVVLVMLVMGVASRAVGGDASGAEAGVLPPGLAFPGVVHPTSDMEVMGWPGLHFAGGRAVVHDARLDATPRGWADELLTIEVGASLPWRVGGNYALFPEGVGANGVGGAVGVIGGQVVVFAGRLRIGDNRAIESVYPTGYVMREAGGVPSQEAPAGVTITRGHGPAWRFEPVGFGERWRLERIEWLKHPGAATRLVYGEQGTPTQIVYPNGHTARITNDGAGRAVEIALPFERKAVIGRDEAGYVVSVEVLNTAASRPQLSRVESHGYGRDAVGRLTRYESSRDGGFSIRYPASYVADPNAPAAFMAAVVRESDKAVWAHRAERVSTKAWRVSQGHGDDEPAAMSVLKASGGKVVDSWPLSGWVGRADGGGWMGADFEVWPSASGSAEPRGDGGGPAGVEYDERGRVVGAVLPKMQTPDAASQATDGKEDADEPWRYEYDPHGNLAASIRDGQTHQFSWDDWGRLTAHYSPDGLRTQWGYGATGALVGVSLSQKESAEDDPLLMTEPVYAPLSATAYVWEDSGQLKEIRYKPEEVERFSYDRDGRLSRWLPAGGSARDAIRYTRDPLGRLTRRIVPTTAEQYVDLHAGHETYRHHPSGRVAVREIKRHGEQPLTYEYDPLGRLVAEAVGRMGRTRYGYDDRGRRNLIVHPAGTQTRYVFDDLNRIISVRGDHQPPIDITYSPLGERLVTTPSPDQLIRERERTSSNTDTSNHGGG